MDIFINSVPLWVSILFLVCILIPIYLIALVVKRGVHQPFFKENSKVKKWPTFVLIFYTTYYLYVTLMSFTGIFQVNSLPPRILLFTAIPLVLFYFIIVFRKKIFWEILDNVRLSDLIRIHIFRLVGIFFIIGWWYGILPKSFAFLGGIGDIIAAISAIFVAILVDKRVKNYQKIAHVWNIIGFCDIVSVILSALYITKEAIENNSQGILEMTKFPFSLIPAFAPATIIFLHICIFKKLKNQK